MTKASIDSLRAYQELIACEYFYKKISTAHYNLSENPTEEEVLSLLSGTLDILTEHLQNKYPSLDKDARSKVLGEAASYLARQHAAKNLSV